MHTMCVCVVFFVVVFFFFLGGGGGSVRELKERSGGRGKRDLEFIVTY